MQLAQQIVEKSCLLGFTWYEKFIRTKPYLVQALYSCNLKQLTLLIIFLSVMVSLLQVLFYSVVTLYGGISDAVTESIMSYVLFNT
jgi:putative copper export protein